MIRYAITDPTGIVIGTGETQNIGTAIVDSLPFGLFHMLPDDSPVGEGWYHAAGGFQILPPRPDGGFWTFDPAAGVWRDPRTELDLQAELYAIRAATSKDKTDLLLTLSSEAFGILSVEEALVAVQGQIPASFQAAFEALPVEVQGIARIKWAGDTTISRMNPLILMAAHAAGIGDDALDLIFGVEVPA